MTAGGLFLPGNIGFQTRKFLLFRREVFLRGAGLFALAWGIRAFVIYFGNYQYLGEDENFYLLSAKGMLVGGYSHDFFLPGWPFILSLLLRLAGGVMGLRFWVIFIDSLTTVIVYLLGRRVFNEKTGFLAGLLVAFYPEQVFFAHYLQAEAGLAFLIAGITYLMFHKNNAVSSSPWIAFLSGIALLFKHFVVVSFAAYLGTLALMKIRRTNLFRVIGFFLLPAVLFSVYWGASGRDPLAVINSPVKSIGEWDNNRPIKIDKSKKAVTLSSHWTKIRERGLLYYYRNFKRNLFNLWTPNSHHITRLYYRRYHALANPRPLAYLSVIYFTLLVVLGLTGLCLGEKTPFRTYSVLSLLFLSGMSLVWFMVSRYRLPFMFLFALQGAYVLANPDPIRRAFNKKNRWRLGCLAGCLSLLVWIYATRLSKLGSWY